MLFRNDSGDLDKDSIDWDSFFRVKTKIDETLAESERLEKKRKEIVSNTQELSEVDAIDKRQRSLVVELKRLRQECRDILSNYGQ